MLGITTVTMVLYRLAIDLMSVLVKERECRDHLITLNCLAVFLR